MKIDKQLPAIIYLKQKNPSYNKHIRKRIVLLTEVNSQK